MLLKKEKMIKVSDLLKLIVIVFHTGYLVGDKPVSLMIIGKVGIGKSELIKKFEVINNIAFFTDVTYMGIIGLLKDNKDVRHVVIPDFLKLTMKRGSTSDNIISVLNSLIEEGLFEISLFGVKEDFKGKQVGLITATTKSSYEQHYKKWNNMGFLSRMLKVSFSYEQETIKKIFDYIHTGKYSDDKNEKIEMPIRNYKIKLKPSLSKKLQDKNTTFRSLKILRTLVKANALLNDREEVILDDIKEIKRLSRFMNLNYTKI